MEMDMNVKSFGTRMSPMLLFLSFTILCVVLPQTHAIWIHIPNSEPKCISEEIHSNVVVLGDYFIFNDHSKGEHASVSATVTSPYGNTLHHHENATHGQFAFTTAETGTYVACFRLGGNIPANGSNLILDWKIGISTKDWDSVAKKEKIEGVELEIRKLEDAVEVIHAFLEYLKEKEDNMMEASEKTYAKVAHYTFVSLGVCIFVGALQVWHLKRFFQKKKLI
ncbi:hypothetical protein TanjilG_05020 [Lupinus angustifolius]|uniref:GOLD domain-containing protein n=1 Tax=Lupinus angustifolius TaxID=3871 RepID=A0A4P1R604_LUPAN|nr:PREDICTED: transmembrane emp24 domain-containing protein p24delta4-like [Lupinus angustifolius]OIW02427.1 hypothetical protein TanjilG_05020 [Lupinus angustifolius]